MTPMQAVAMGLVIAFLDPEIAGYDGLPDVAGWALVVYGLVGLRDRVSVWTLVPVAVLAGLVSVPLTRLSVVEGLSASTGWALSLPQVAFSFLLAGEVAAVVGPPLARRLRGLRWAFVAVAAGPILLYGGELARLRVPLAVLAVASNLYLVYLLFRASSELHGPRVRVRRESPEP